MDESGEAAFRLQCSETEIKGEVEAPDIGSDTIITQGCGKAAIAIIGIEGQQMTEYGWPPVAIQAYRRIR